MDWIDTLNRIRERVGGGATVVTLETDRMETRLCVTRYLVNTPLHYMRVVDGRLREAMQHDPEAATERLCREADRQIRGLMDQQVADRRTFRPS